MKLHQLRYFQCLSHYLHYRKASEALYISQPTLSFAIKELAIQDVITGGDGRNNIPRRMALKLADGSTKFIDRRGTEVPDGAVPYVDEDTYYPSHVATDFYHHYKEDIALFAQMGFKSFLLSLIVFLYLLSFIYKKNNLKSTYNFVVKRQKQLLKKY